MTLRDGLTPADTERILDRNDYTHGLRDSDMTIAADPRRPFVPSLCGHLMVPRSSASRRGPPAPHTSERRSSSQHESFVLVVATKHIPAGQEVLAPYGYEYWCRLPLPTIRTWMAEFASTKQASVARILKRFKPGAIGP